MKVECCRPPSVNGPAQQQRFDRWRKNFNEERPHEGLGMRIPADAITPRRSVWANVSNRGCTR